MWWWREQRQVHATERPDSLIQVCTISEDDRACRLVVLGLDEGSSYEECDRVLDHNFIVRVLNFPSRLWLPQRCSGQRYTLARRKRSGTRRPKRNSNTDGQTKTSFIANEVRLCRQAVDKTGDGGTLGRE